MLPSRSLQVGYTAILYAHGGTALPKSSRCILVEYVVVGYQPPPSFKTERFVDPGDLLLAAIVVALLA